MLNQTNFKAREELLLKSGFKVTHADSNAWCTLFRMEWHFRNQSDVLSFVVDNSDNSYSELKNNRIKKVESAMNALGIKKVIGAPKF